MRVKRASRAGLEIRQLFDFRHFLYEEIVIGLCGVERKMND